MTTSTPPTPVAALLAALTLLLMAAAPASAQGVGGLERETFFSAALGTGGMSCSECVGEWDIGASGYAGAGQRIGDRTVLGVELGLWARPVEGTVMYRLDYLATTRFAPFAGSGFFLKAGLGAATLNLHSEIGTARTTRLGGVAGLGYDFDVDAPFSLSLWIDAAGHLRSERAYGLHTGLAATWR
jgi:hypothetical protein